MGSVGFGISKIARIEVYSKFKLPSFWEVNHHQLETNTPLGAEKFVIGISLMF